MNLEIIKQGILNGWGTPPDRKWYDLAMKEITPKKPEEELPEEGQEVKFKTKNKTIHIGVCSKFALHSGVGCWFLSYKDNITWPIVDVEWWIGLPEVKE